MSATNAMSDLFDEELGRRLYLAQIELRYAEKRSTRERAMSTIETIRAEMKRRNIPEPA